MKNRLLRIVSLCLTVLILMPAFVIDTVAAEESGVYSPTAEEFERKGIKFSSSTYSKMTNALPILPMTFEAEIMLATTNRAGVILGDFKSNYANCISFEIHEQGRPRIYVENTKGEQIDLIFDKASVLSSDFVKLTVTIDSANGKAHCYINGALKQTKDFSYEGVLNSVPSEPFWVGGDPRNKNERAFQGLIKTVSVFSDMRTSKEIAGSVDLKDENLLVHYDLINSGTTNLSKLKGYDLTSNNMDLLLKKKGGLTFTGENTYRVMKSFNSQIFTYEAMVYIPKSIPDNTRIGTLFGNYSSNAFSTNFEFKEKASPRLYFEGNGGTLYDFHFTNVDARADDWTFVTITLDTKSGLASCYLNGELKQTISAACTINEATYKSEFYLGRDTRGGSSGNYFKGAVKSLAVYSDVRTDNEIKADMVELNKDSDGLLAMYEFTKDTGRSDMSGNCYHICYSGEARPEDTSTPDTPNSPTESSGLSFSGSDYAIVGKKFPIDSSQYTFEAVIQLPKSVSGRGGVILGNYKDGNNHYLSFEIYSNGVPRITCTKADNLNTKYDYRFSNVDVRDEAPVHLAITLDRDTGVANCYINGQLKQTLSYNAQIDLSSAISDIRMVLGNDLRSGTKVNFNGVISSVAVYTDIRTGTEIYRDVGEIDTSSDNLAFYYNLSGATAGEDIKDLSGNGYNVKYGTPAQAEGGMWFTDKDEVTDYIYSFAVVGDTQIIACNHGSKFGMIYDWILNNRVSKKIGYVFGLGDITNYDSSSEWALAKTHILEKLTGIIPYSVVRGNHDGVNNINAVFATESYMSQFDGFYEANNVVNSYRFFEISDTEYLLFTLDYGADDNVLNWAGAIIEANPTKKVIITTHAYLYRDGTTLDQGDVCPPATTGGANNGDDMWNKLVSKYENMYLIISGHDPSANVVVTQTEGVNGNIVTQILTDHQGVDTSVATGMVTMLYFKTDGSIEVETYSTIQDAYYKENNQFTIEETEHKYIEKNGVYTYANGYTKKGTARLKCEFCQKEILKEAEAMIALRGYSAREDKTAICVDYYVNFDILEAYEKTKGVDVIFGLVACERDSLVNKDNKPIKSDATSAEVSSGKVLFHVMEANKQNSSIIIRSDDWSKQADLNVILCMYVIEDGAVTYLCDTEGFKDAALSVTYNQIMNGQN